MPQINHLSHINLFLNPRTLKTVKEIVDCNEHSEDCWGTTASTTSDHPVLSDEKASNSPHQFSLKSWLNKWQELSSTENQQLIKVIHLLVAWTTRHVSYQGENWVLLSHGKSSGMWVAFNFTASSKIGEQLLFWSSWLKYRE